MDKNKQYLIFLILFVMVLYFFKKALNFITDVQITKNFKRSEFDCNDAKKTKVPDNYLGNLRVLCDNLEILRSHFGNVPIYINSGYRTYEHNQKVGGKEESYHLSAQAADIRVKGKTPKEVYNALLKLMNENKIRKGGLGLYGTFVHYDVRGKIVLF